MAPGLPAFCWTPRLFLEMRHFLSALSCSTELGFV
jgi:hypothetical protein